LDLGTVEGNIGLAEVEALFKKGKDTNFLLLLLVHAQEKIK
jgi:dephospho-CoA kinase